VRAFFIEMQEQAKTSAAIIYEALNSALDKTSDQLSQPPDWQENPVREDVRGDRPSDASAEHQVWTPN
jgi:hypothetical protein